MSLKHSLEQALAARDAKGIRELAELASATWFKRVAALRAEWLGKDIKSASQYGDAFERLATKAGTREPSALLEFAARKTASKSSLRIYRAAIKHVLSRQHAEALQEVLREADRVNAKARKAAGDASWGGDAATVYSGIVYETKLAPIADALDALTASLEEAKQVKPSGAKVQRSHNQRTKLARLPSDWQERMLDRMRRGRGRAEGKWATHAAASVLVGLRPSEMASMTFYREGPLLVVNVEGAKHGTASVPTKDGKWKTVGTGRKEREFCFDLSKLDGAALTAAERLYAKAPANGAQVELGESEAFASAWRAAALREFGEKLAPSAYANRHQFASELKARGVGADADQVQALRHQIAAALGHASTATQSVYGRPARGAGLPGLVTVSATGQARSARPPAPPGRKAKSVAKTAPPSAPRPRSW